MENTKVIVSMFDRVRILKLRGNQRAFEERAVHSPTDGLAGFTRRIAVDRGPAEN